MIESLLGIALLLLLSGLFVFLFLRSIRPRRTVLKWVGAVLSAVMALLFAALTLVGVSGFSKLFLPRTPQIAEVSVQATAEQVARGEHLASILCADCHSQDRTLPLSGGADFGADAPFPVGSLPAYNLTPAGPVADWSDTDLYRAIRYNVDPNGRRLVVMSATGIGNLSDEDTHAMIAYLRSQPVTGTETRQEKPTAITSLLSGAGMFPVRARAVKVVMPPIGETPDYGKYMVDFLSCADCHGEDLRGGAGGAFFPAGPNLTTGVPSWTVDQFKTAIRTGVRPYGPPLNPDLMPWPIYSNMDDTELAAVHAYLSSLKE